MKPTTIYTFLIILSLSFISTYSQDIPADSLFLGQTPPGYTAKVFNLPITPGLRPAERIAITRDGKEIYYGELDSYPVTIGRIKCVKYQNNKWQAPTIVFDGFMGAKLSPNDSVIYMQREVNGIAMAFYSKRTAAGWSEPARVFKSTAQQHYFQMVKSGNCYLSSGPSSNREICKVEAVNNDTLFQNLGFPINSANDENDFVVADDESFIILSRSNSSTAGDMFISYKNSKGKWTNPKPLGPQVNTPHPNWEYGQFLSKGNKYLFFTRGGNIMSEYSVYWVKIDNLIDSMKNTNNPPILKNSIPNQLTMTGQTYNYAVPDSTFYDDDGNNTLTFSAVLANGSPLPAWLKFDSVKCVFSGIPTDVAFLNITVTAKDTANESISCNFVLRVTKPSSVEKSKTGSPEGFYLFNNYPNPFNPSTTIEFAIAQKGRYSLKVYSLLGQLVRVLADKEYPAGYHKESFDSLDLPSGMYIYRLTGNNINLSQKMILMR